MLFREQVAHTALLDPPLQPRRAFHGTFAPCQALSNQLLRALPFLRNKRPERQDYHQQFLCNVVSLPFLRTQTALINQFVTVHFSNCFSYRYCESVDLFKKRRAVATCQAIKKSSTKFAPSTTISNPSVTSLLLTIAKHCMANRLISLQQVISMLRLGKPLPHQRPLFS